MTLVKALGTYLCWTRITTGRPVIQLLNCYLEPGDQQFQKDRAKRVTDIVKDIIKQDANANIVVSGDFNNHINHMYQQLHFLGFQRVWTLTLLPIKWVDIWIRSLPEVLRSLTQ